MSYFISYCESHYGQQLSAYKVASSTLDLRGPHTWYPYARALQRDVQYHGGEVAVVLHFIMMNMSLNLKPLTPKP